ncbi:hypothetical protein EAKG_02488 [Escherichia coli B574]|nr:hypothetical protein EALG_01000 [Escherichia coli TA144]OSK31762.1 hypothetical protein EAKG_02488 [Escherichia coli B574]OSK40429.1 hypothetical protein EAHG_01139 [Escherichia coli B671]OSK44293.1 hypothetical protein EAIG_02650 [Escherichia coli B108]
MNPFSIYENKYSFKGENILPANDYQEI